MMQWIDFQQTLNQRLNREQLDDRQNKARNFNVNGHSLVRGVAGSGKSLVLRNRVEKIIEERLNPVLVLSYNRFMKGWIQSTLSAKGLKVDCRTFHEWGDRLGKDHLVMLYENKTSIVEQIQDALTSPDQLSSESLND